MFHMKHILLMKCFQQFYESFQIVFTVVLDFDFTFFPVRFNVYLRAQCIDQFFGGIRRVAKFAEAIVPLMAVLYLLMALYVIATNFAAIPAVFGLMPAMKGNVDLAYGLRYEPSDHSVRMTNVEVKSVDLKDEKGQGNSRANNALAMVGEQMFQDYTLYKFTASDLEKASKYQYTPTTITVKRNGVDVLLVPRK